MRTPGRNTRRFYLDYSEAVTCVSASRPERRGVAECGSHGLLQAPNASVQRCQNCFKRTRMCVMANKVRGPSDQCELVVQRLTDRLTKRRGACELGCPDPGGRNSGYERQHGHAHPGSGTSDEQRHWHPDRRPYHSHCSDASRCQCERGHFRWLGAVTNGLGRRNRSRSTREWAGSDDSDRCHEVHQAGSCWRRALRLL